MHNLLIHKNLEAAPVASARPFTRVRRWFTHAFDVTAMPASLPSCFFLFILLYFGNPVAAQTGVDSVATADTAKIDSAVATAPQPDTSKPYKHLYKMNYWATGGIIVLATAGNLYAIPNILHAKKPISTAELEALDPEVTNSIDRVALRQDPERRASFKQASDIILPATVVAGAVMFLDKRVQKDWFRVLAMYVETQAITFSLYNFSPFGPSFQNRLRPLVYYDKLSVEERTSGGNRNSFFSGHTANVAAATFFMAKVYSDYHPELGRKKYWLYTLAAVPPLVEGFMRVRALEHFPSDVAAGFIMGAVTGVVIPALHRVRTHNVQLQVTYSQFGGAGMRMFWQPQATSKKQLKTFVAGS